MSFLVEPPIAVTLKLISTAGRDRWFSSVVVNVIDELVAVVTSVGEHSAPVHFDVLQQRNRVTDVTELSLADHEVHRITVSVYYCMDLGGSSSSAMSDFVGNAPFLALALC